MEIYLLILLTLTFIPAVATPGPDAAFAVAQSLTHGANAAVIAPVSFAVATAIQVTLIFSGVDLILSNFATVFTLLKWTGVIYLFWMAYKVYKSSSESLFE